MTRRSPELIIRQTSQRDTILRVIEKADRPLTTPEIHQMAKKTSKNLGLRTVQRHMNCLVELKQIEWLPFLGLPKRYQLVDLRGPFVYAICRKCRTIYRILVPDKPEEIPYETLGFVVERSEKVYSGICDACIMSGCNSGVWEG
jgi:Fur family transcriptional regulator, ferric uptake regulator